MYVCSRLPQPLIPCHAKYLYLYYKVHFNRYYQSKAEDVTFSVNLIGRTLYINKVLVQ